MVRRLADEYKRLDELALSGVGIRAALSLSYNSLSEDSRQLFRRLGLLGATTFAGWAAAPLMNLGWQEAEDLLDLLVEVHLVQVKHQDSGARFQLHELVRIFAAERLAAEERMTTREEALERLLGCWLSLAEQAHRRCYGGDFALIHGAAARWALPSGVVEQLLERPLVWLRAERSGLVSAVLTAAQAGLGELCWDLAMTSVTLFESDHEVDEWRRTHEAALAVVRRTGNRRGEAAMLYSLGSLSARQRPDSAARYLDPALRIFTELDDVHGRALTLASIAFVEELAGHHEQALGKYLESLTGLVQVGDLIGEADVLINLAQIHQNSGRLEVVQGLLDRAASIGQTLGAPRTLAQAEYRRGGFHLRVDDLERAEKSFSLAVDVTQRHADLVGKTYALSGLGMVHTRQGRLDLAEASLSEAHILSLQLGDSLARGQVLLARAELCLARDQPGRAAAFLSEIQLPFAETEPDALWRARYAELKARTGGPPAGYQARPDEGELRPL
jgi:tetratricopeptide (TPR) repeat protein